MGAEDLENGKQVHLRTKIRIGKGSEIDRFWKNEKSRCSTGGQLTTWATHQWNEIFTIHWYTSKLYLDKI